ncbi:MAG TPA: mechanosensitive ion channel family protein [Gammaproteobacteria bacterium]|nr:mechanosensitive ion channel family protein [Gammaproteobacteria bacterium]
MPKGFQDFLAKFDYAALLQNAIRIAIIILVAIVLWFIIRFVISRVAKRMVDRAVANGEGTNAATQRAQTLSSLIRKLVAALYWVAVVLTLLSQIGVNIGALVAGAGIAGLALSFGAQSLVKDYISGFFIVLENQISVGDVATLNGTGGVVEEINFRTIVLRGGDGSVHVFRNGDITQLQNQTRGWSGYMFEIGVAYKEDTDRVIATIERIGREMKEDRQLGASMIQELEIFGVNQLGDSAVVITGRLKTQPGAHWGVGRAFLARVKKTFDAAGIELPFPQQTLWFGAGGAPLRITRAEQATAKEKQSDPDAPA